MKELKVNLEFKKLIPPLSEQEFEQLEQNCLKDGIRDAIVTWQGFIIDGHNRYEISQRYNLPFDTIEKDFESEDQVKIWMIDNQKGRRNLTDGWIWELAQERKKLLHEKGEHKYKLTAGRPKKSLSNVDNDLSKENHNTQKEISTELGWSTGKVAMADKVWRTAKPEVKEKIKSGEISINQAYNEIKKEEKKAAFVQKKNEFQKDVLLKNKSIIECYKGSCLDIMRNINYCFDLLLSDPPYAMDYKSGWNNWDKINGDKRNETVVLLDNAFAVCKEKLKPDAHIYIFGNPYEIETIKPIFEKYFRLMNILIWDRSVIGMGDLRTYGRSYDIILFGYNETWKELNGTRDKDVLPFSRVAPNLLFHPTEKPTGILEYIIKKSTNENDFILDPFAGSCSTLKAANNLNRNSIGIEIEEKYIPKWILKKT